MFYRTILSRAWNTTWRHKYLWFFGLFAALLGNGGEIELIFRGLNNNTSQGFLMRFKEFASTGIFNKNIFANISKLATEAPFSLFMVLVTLFILVALIIFMLWLIIVSQTALVHNSARDYSGKKHDLKEGLEVGIKKFWPVLTLNIGLKIIILAVLGLISAPIVAGISSGLFSLSGLLYVISYLVLIPLIIILSFIARYIIAYVVIKGESLGQSIRSGWNLFTKNWLISIEMAFLLFAINFLIALAVIVGILIVAVPFFFVLLVFTKIAFYINVWILILIALIFFLCIIVFTGAVLATFQINAWTTLYIELAGKGGVSKLVRVFSKK